MDGGRDSSAWPAAEKSSGAIAAEVVENSEEALTVEFSTDKDESQRSVRFAEPPEAETQGDVEAAHPAPASLPLANNLVFELD